MNFSFVVGLVLQSVKVTCAVCQYRSNQGYRMGLLLKSAVLVLAWWAGGGGAQPTCNYDSHCDEGFYCENFTCRQCLKCKDFKREDPTSPASCIESVVKCGPCLKGLIEDPRNDISTACVPPQDSFGRTWIVITIVVAVILSLLGCVFILYILRKKGIFKMHAYLGASMESQSGMPRPSAPAELPPPYARYDANRPVQDVAVESDDKPEDVVVNGNGVLQPQLQPQPRAVSPYDGQPRAMSPYDGQPRAMSPYDGQPRAVSPYDGLNTYTVNEEARQPFIKRASPPPTRRSRVVAGHQDARVFNRPAYHYPNFPEPTYIDGADHDVDNIHDADTVESPWTPAQEQIDNIENAVGPAVLVTENGDLTAQLDAARGTVLVRPPRDPHPHPQPAKKKCLSQDSNNNGNQAGSGEPSMSGGSASATAMTTAIKVNMQATLQLNTLHQHGHPTYNGDPVPR